MKCPNCNGEGLFAESGCPAPMGRKCPVCNGTGEIDDAVAKIAQGLAVGEGVKALMEMLAKDKECTCSKVTEVLRTDDGEIIDGVFHFRWCEKVVGVKK